MATPKKTPPKKKASARTEKPGGAAARAPLSEAVKTALGIAVSEVFVENVERAVKQPEKLLHSDLLGRHYEGYHRGMLTEKQAAERLRELSPWLDEQFVTKVLDHAKGDSAVDFACDLYDEVALAAGIELAEAILLLALGRERDVPERARPYLPHLRGLATRLARKMKDRDTSEYDATQEIFGEAR